MKQLSIIINIVLAIALGVLYYLHFSSQAPSASKGTGESVAAGDLSIAFINADSVLKHYDYFKLNREKLEAKGKKLDTDFRNRAQGLQREIASYQSTAANLTMGQARALEEDLTKKQQNLRVYQESLAQELANDENKLNQELYERVTAFVRDFGTQKGIQAVFKYDLSSDLLFAGESMDITNEVIAGLNDSFKNNNAVANDSTKVK